MPSRKGSRRARASLKTINVLIVVDALGALAAQDLMNNVYLIDTNKYLGSWQEGTVKLHTVCQDGQLIAWRAAPVSPSNDVSIAGFSGQMVTSRICVPTKRGDAGDSYWEGRIETKGGYGQYLYTVELSIDGRVLSLSPYVKVV